jgi:putative ubiquitin-RnfH superfamily antitoxin RatB of RatAB toxin-antitoxin module
MRSHAAPKSCMADRAGAIIRVEVIFAEPDAAHRFVVTLPPGSTVDDALKACPGLDAIAPIGRDGRDVGIHGVRHELNDEVRDGDRVELYRPLIVDPKLARRRRAGGHSG